MVQGPVAVPAVPLLVRVKTPPPCLVIVRLAAVVALKTPEKVESTAPMSLPNVIALAVAEVLVTTPLPLIPAKVRV